MQELSFRWWLVVPFTQDESRQYVGVRIAQLRPALADQLLQIRQHLGDRTIAIWSPALRSVSTGSRRSRWRATSHAGTALVVRYAEQVADNADPDR